MKHHISIFFVVFSLLIAPAWLSAADPECTTEQVCPNIDWSFFGPPDPAQVEETLRIAKEHRKKTREAQKACETGDAVLIKDDEIDGCDAVNMLASDWLSELAKQARDGHPSIVRMPLYLCVGWGSVVVTNYTTVECFGMTNHFIEPVGGVGGYQDCDQCWRDPKYDERDAYEDCKDKYCGDWWVEGYFSGETKRSESEHCSYCAADQFHVLRTRYIKQGEKEHTKLMLPAGSGPPTTAVITEGPRFGVYLGGFFRSDPESQEEAIAAVSKLKEAGFENAQVMDSRAVSTLWCCSYLVLVDRFEEKKEAKTLKKTLEKTGFDGVVVRELY